MYKLISFTGQSALVSSSMKELKAKLEAMDKKVSIVQLKLPAKQDASPYIASTYDTNFRYDKTKQLVEKYKTSDYVFITGYSLDTMLREIPKLQSISAMKSYCYWLDAIESVTYQIPRADKTVTIRSAKAKNLSILESVVPYAITNIHSKNLTQLLDQLLEVKKPAQGTPKSKTKGTLLEVIASLGKGTPFQYNELSPPTEKENPELHDLLTLRKLVVKELGEDNYFAQIIQPLGTPYSLDIKHAAHYSDAIEKVLDNFDGNFYPNALQPTVTFNPRNELQLADQIGWEYGYETNNLTYIEKTRIIETWAQSNQRNNDALHIKCQTTLSYHDIFTLIKNFRGIKITIQKPSPHVGFVDISEAPDKITEAIEYAFDQSTKLCAVTSNTDFLLMGHRTSCEIVLNYSHYKKIEIFPSINLSEEFRQFQVALKDSLQVAFPSIHAIN